MTTNVPSPQFTDRGFVSPAEDAVLAGVLADFNAAFGGDLNLALETPQGQLASSLAAIISNCYDLFCNLAGQVDPAYASGRMQDAIGRIYFQERSGALSTVVAALCTGLQGVRVPTGALALAQDGNIYTCVSGGRFPSNGQMTLSFACLTVGPVPCPAGTLTTIYQAVNGWDSIDNLADGVLGIDTETRQLFEARRAQSVAVNAVGYLQAVLSAVLSVHGVLDAYVTENATNAPVTIGDRTLPANCLYVAAVGGDDDDVAAAIWSKKAPGCSYDGNTTVQVQDPSSVYRHPRPTYDVTFERPPSLAVLFAVNISNSPQVPADAVTQVQTALISAFAGEDGGPRARIGSTIYATRFFAPVAALGSWAQIVSLLIGSKNAAAAQFTASVAGVVMTVTAVASGTLAVGQTISASGLAAGTRIASLGSGTGGTGTYNLNVSDTVGSRAMVAAVANQNTVDAFIDQAPTISAANIAVTLT